MDYHHSFFGLDKNYWEDRNNANQWILLCREHHEEAHLFKSWNWIRQDCINYLASLKE